MILIIDNYDSFTYNLAQYVGDFTADIQIYRNDQISVVEIEQLQPQKIIISPGPGRPEHAGISVDVIKHFAPRTPILGICLGHQALGVAYGAVVTHAPYLMHGKASLITHSGTDIFQGLADPFLACRYHSLAIEPGSLPPDLVATAWTNDRLLMGVKHQKYHTYGLQFHPESILTETGKKIISNFLLI